MDALASDAPQPLVLRGDDLGMRFGRRVLFRRLALHAEGGEALGLLGANGSGKSTLVKVLAGLLRPSRGSVTLDLGGEAVPDEQRPFHAGLVAPYLHVYDALSARENLRFLATVRGLSNAETRIAEVLAHVGLAGREDDRVATYSSGMQQRVKLAAALLAHPPLLFLDEPSVTLDAAGRQLVQDAVQAQTARGGLVVLATNDEREAALCSRALRIDAFR